MAVQEMNKYRVHFPLLFVDAEMKEVIYEIHRKTEIAIAEVVVFLNATLVVLNYLHATGIEYEIPSVMSCKHVLNDEHKQQSSETLNKLKELLVNKNKKELYSLLKSKEHFLKHKKAKNDNDSNESSKGKRNLSPFQIWRNTYGL